jgi:D-lyxose ketol-isomerase
MQPRNSDMQELAEGLKISRAGAKKEAPLELFRRQMDNWNIAMPPVEPLVLDFGLNDFDRVGLIEYWIANEKEAGYCGKYLFVFDGQECPSHSHRTKHETFFLVRGCVDVTMDGRSITLAPGSVLPVPPGHLHSFRGKGNSLLLELSMPCEVRDNCFADPQIMVWLAKLV